MIKVYCDMCGKSIEQETIYRAAFSVFDHDTHSFSSIGREVDLCTECYEKITNIKGQTEKPEPQKRMENLKKDIRELQETAKKPKAEKEKPEDPEEKKIDDGKIWALAHGKQPWTIRQIAEEMNIPQSTVSYHLRKMREERGEG